MHSKHAKTNFIKAISTCSKEGYNMAKYEIHQRTVNLVNDFNTAWDFLHSKGELTLRTEKSLTPFFVYASIVQRAKHSGERVIKVLNKDTRRASAYVFKCCWGYHTNCYGEGTRIGTYCQALDNHIINS